MTGVVHLVLPSNVSNHLVVKRRELSLRRQLEDEEDKEALFKVFQEQSKNIASSAPSSNLTDKTLPTTPPPNGKRNSDDLMVERTPGPELRPSDGSDQHCDKR